MASVTGRCRELRKNQTDAEKTLWYFVRGRKRKGHKFLRQYPLYADQLQGRRFYFIADFYCAEAKLVIEVDGNYHSLIKAEDESRDEVVSALGLKTIRFTNDEVVRNLTT